MSEAKLYLRRIGTEPKSSNLTSGKLYQVVNANEFPPTILDDHGREWMTVAAGELWQKVWLLPDGSEVPAL